MMHWDSRQQVSKSPSESIFEAYLEYIFIVSCGGPRHVRYVLAEWTNDSIAKTWNKSEPVNIA